MAGKLCTLLSRVCGLMCPILDSLRKPPSTFSSTSNVLYNGHSSCVKQPCLFRRYYQPVSLRLLPEILYLSSIPSLFPVKAFDRTLSQWWFMDSSRRSYDVCCSPIVISSTNGHPIWLREQIDAGGGRRCDGWERRSLLYLSRS